VSDGRTALQFVSKFRKAPMMASQVKDIFWASQFSLLDTRFEPKTLLGKALACWCNSDEVCHADELLRPANA
jgi:Domain of unknown function (DUF4326)